MLEFCKDFNVSQVQIKIISISLLLLNVFIDS
jgi:hypothetical protein